MNNKLLNFLKNLLLPPLFFGVITGVLTTLVITIYKICAKYVIAFSEKGYHFLKTHLFLAVIGVFALYIIALLFNHIYKKVPNIKGGGIPSAISAIKGFLSFSWFKSLVGTFFLSLLTFFLGVPLGNEGPSVFMGTAIGKGFSSLLSKKHKEFDELSLSCGAAVGFSVATGSHIAGFMFVLEEVFKRFSLSIIVALLSAASTSLIVTKALSHLFNINLVLFPKLSTISLTLKDIWLPLVIGVAVGLFSVLFLKYYKIIYNFINIKLKGFSSKYKIFLVFLFTLILGIVSHSFISTGHELTVSLLTKSPSTLILILILIVRVTLTLSANSCGVTGGTFFPLLAIGAVFSAVLAQSLDLFGLNQDYYLVVLVLGITATIAGMMKMPLTAIAFSVQALSSYNNVIFIIVAAFIAYFITKIFNVKSINDSSVEILIKKETNI